MHLKRDIPSTCRYAILLDLEDQSVEATRRSCVSRTVKNEPVSSFLCVPIVLFSPKWKAGEFSSWNLALLYSLV